MQLENYMINLASLATQNAIFNTITAEFFNASLFKVENVEGFCGEKNGILYVAFQGTNPNEKQDILDDLNFKKINLGNKIKVHAGFYKQWLIIKPFITDKIKNNVKVIFTGYSLGGALAVLASYEMKQFYTVQKSIGCVTFASPKVGGESFVKKFNSILIDIKQYKHKKDPVTLLPCWWMGYSYTSKQIKFGKLSWYEWILPFNFKRHLPENYTNFKV